MFVQCTRVCSSRARVNPRYATSACSGIHGAHKKCAQQVPTISAPIQYVQKYFLRAQLPLHARSQFGGGRVINGAGLPCQRKSTTILIFWNNVKVHMHHFLMRKRAVVLQNVVRRGAGRLHDCAGHMRNGRPQCRGAFGRKHV